MYIKGLFHKTDKCMSGSNWDEYRWSIVVSHYDFLLLMSENKKNTVCHYKISIIIKRQT